MKLFYSFMLTAMVGALYPDLHNAASGFCADAKETNASGVSVAPGSRVAEIKQVAAGVAPARYEQLWHTAKFLIQDCRSIW